MIKLLFSYLKNKFGKCLLGSKKELVKRKLIISLRSNLSPFSTSTVYRILKYLAYLFVFGHACIIYFCTRMKYALRFATMWLKWVAHVTPVDLGS